MMKIPRFRIRTLMALVAVAAVASTVPLAARDRRELVRIDRGIDGLNSSIGYCKMFRFSTDPPPSSGFFPGSRWEALAPVADGTTIRTWDDERALFDRAIARYREQIRSLERRREEIRRRWPLGLP